MADITTEKISQIFILLTLLFNKKKRTDFQSSILVKTFVLHHLNSECPEQDSNLHAFRNLDLNQARLPIPPPGQRRKFYLFENQLSIRVAIPYNFNMVGFLIKKSFFDGWDNFLALFLSNLAFAFILLSFLVVGQSDYCSTIGMCAVFSALFGALLCIVYLGISGVAYQWSNYSRSYLTGLKRAFKGHWLHCLFFYAIIVCVLFCIIFLIPFYLASGSYIGVMLAVFMFWFFVVIIPAMQYYFPLAIYMENDSAFLTFKKSLALVFNNKAFTLFVTLKTIFDLALSICTCFLIPGFTGIALSHTDAVKLLMLRHDYMREHGVAKEDINIFELFEDEQAKVGKRTLRGTIFPWKQ